MRADAEIAPAQRALVASWKDGRHAACALPIVGDDGIPLGALEPMTETRAADDLLVHRMAAWRGAHPQSFLTVTTPSPEATRDYLNRICLGDPGRILFLAFDTRGHAIGNVGLANISAADAELDNVLRGEPPPRRDFMHAAQTALLAWAFAELGIAAVYLNVLADNPPALSAYRRLGFGETGRRRLARQRVANGYRFVPGVDGEATERELVAMTLDRDAFHRAGPNGAV